MKAGYSHVAVICDDAGKLQRIKAAISESVEATQVDRLGFYSTPEFIAWLRDQAPLHAPAAPEQEMRRGYRVKRTAVPLSEDERKQREDAILKTVTDAVKKSQRKR